MSQSASTRTKTTRFSADTLALILLALAAFTLAFRTFCTRSRFAESLTDNSETCKLYVTGERNP